MERCLQQQKESGKLLEEDGLSWKRQTWLIVVGLKVEFAGLQI
jgi:hypothetical protein